MDYLEKILKIHPAETRKAAYLAVFFFAVGFYCMAITAVAFSVFNIRFGARLLPYIFLLFPFLYLFCSVIYIKVLPHSDKKVFFRYFILLVLVLHLFGFFILSDAFQSSVFYAVLLLIVMFIEDNLLILSVIIVQNITDIESIKRLLPLTSGSATIGAVSASLLLSYTAHIYNSLQLFSFFFIFIVIIAGSADILLSRHQAASTGKLDYIGRGFIETLQFIKTNWFYALLILQVIVVLIVANINDFFYHVIVSDALRNESSVMAFIGLTGAFQYLFFLVFSFFILLRLVIKAGSLNGVKIVLLSAIIGAILMMFSQDMIMLALVSKVIFFVLVVGFNASLEQILYKTVDPRFHDSFIATTDLFVSFSGYLLAGLIALLFSYGLISIYVLTGVSIVITAAILAAWHYKQPAFVQAMQNTLSFSEDLDVEKLFGNEGIKRYLPLMTQKISDGSSVEKAFALDIMDRLDFEGKETLLQGVFKKGTLLVKFKILDMIFEKKIPGHILIGLIGSMEPPVQQYLVKHLFLNYREMNRTGLVKLVAQEKACIKKELLDRQILLMFEYLFENKNMNFRKIIAELISDKTGDNCLDAIKIMSNFTGLEDDCNRRYLPELMQHLKARSGLLSGCVELCSFYEGNDSNGNQMYLEMIFAGCCNYKLIKEINDCYGFDKIKKTFGRSDLLIPQIYLLHSAGQKRVYADDEALMLYKNIRGRLHKLILEKQKISTVAHPARNLLLEEIDHLIATVSAVLTDFLFKYYSVPEIGDLEQLLVYKDKKNMVCEVVKNVLPLKASAEILPLLKEDIVISDQAFCYEALDTGTCGLNLMNLYKYLGGSQLDQALAEEINRIVILKSVPLFAELDLEMLRQVLQVTEFKTMPAGSEIIKKGQSADWFFVIVEGKVGVYPQESGEAIAIIGPGEICGELAVIDGGKRTATVKTLEDLHFLKFEGQDFITLLQKNSQITYYVIKILSRRLRGMLEAVDSGNCGHNI